MKFIQDIPSPDHGQHEPKTGVAKFVSNMFDGHINGISPDPDAMKNRIIEHRNQTIEDIHSGKMDWLKAGHSGFSPDTSPSLPGDDEAVQAGIMERHQKTIEGIRRHAVKSWVHESNADKFEPLMARMELPPRSTGNDIEDIVTLHERGMETADDVVAAIDVAHSSLRRQHPGLREPHRSEL